MITNIAEETSVDARPQAAPDVIGPANQVPHGRVVDDLPMPAVLANPRTFTWNSEKPPAHNYQGLGQALAATGDLYRNARYTAGLQLASKSPRVPPSPVVDPTRLAAIIADRINVCVTMGGEVVGNMVPTAHLKTMLQAEVFLQAFPPLDRVTRVPMYLPDFTVTQPGYNDGGLGSRIFYAGERAEHAEGHSAITRFLDVMAFKSNADRTNTVAAALTVRLRNHEPGAKPMILVTSNKSQAGKETINAFAAGPHRITSVSYQSTDWALERAVVGALKHNPDTAVICVENARLERGSDYIQSGFIERLITDPEPLFFSTGSGGPVSRANDLVVAISTNQGHLSTDLMNRSLPIHLECRGNIEDRVSPIGNPRYEYLPRHQLQIDAELRGMVAKWVRAGRPLDEQVRHPFTGWARTIGGILKVNGFTDFLANYAERKNVQDPVRTALGILGAASPDEFLPPAKWAELAREVGVDGELIAAPDRGSLLGRERGIGRRLTAHDGEVFIVTTEDEKLTLQLERARRRFDHKPSTRYRFTVLTRESLPVDAA